MARLCHDNETGEIIPCQVNNETGEQLNNPCVFPNLTKEEPPKFPHYFRKSKKNQDFKDNLSRVNSNTMSHRMLLLLPTLLIFSSIISVILILIEVFLHIRCHNKNKTLKDKDLYYRSPFHIVTRTFCGVCKDNAMVNKIGILQDKRRYQYDYLKRIAI